MTGKNGGPVTKVKKLEVMTELENLITEGTILGVTNEQLAKKFSISRQTISEYLKEIYLKIPAEDIKETEVKLKAMFDKIFRYSQNIMQQAQTPLEKERALNIMLRAMKEYTDFLERFGIKQKIADKVEITSLNVNIDVEAESKAILEEIS